MTNSLRNETTHVNTARKHEMLISALNLLQDQKLSSKVSDTLEHEPDLYMCNCNVVENVAIVSLVGIDVVPNDPNDPGAVLRLARLSYQLYSKGLLVAMGRSGGIVLWVPVNLGEAFIEALSTRFNLQCAFYQPPPNYFTAALVRSLTLLTEKIIPLGTRILVDNWIATVICSDSNDVGGISLSLSFTQSSTRWEQCNPTLPSFTLDECTCIAPYLSPLSVIYLEEYSTQDEDSEQRYLGACFQWGYSLDRALFTVITRGDSGETDSSVVFQNMLIKRLTKPATTEAIMPDRSATSTMNFLVGLLKKCIDLCNNFSVNDLASINVFTPLLPNRRSYRLIKLSSQACLMSMDAKTKEPPHKELKQAKDLPTQEVDLNQESEGMTILPALSAYTFVEKKEGKDTVSERIEKVNATLQRMAILPDNIRALLGELRSRVESGNKRPPELQPIELAQLKPVPSKKKRVPRKPALMMPPQEQEKEPSHDQDKPTKEPEVKKSKKPKRAVHFNTIVIFIDEWNKAHKIKLQQREPTTYHQENDIQQDIQSEFIISLLS